MEIATIRHELDHVFLAKESSLWHLIQLNNIHAYTYFFHLLIFNNNFKKHKPEVFKESLMELIFEEEYNNAIHDRWNIVQEYVGILYHIRRREEAKNKDEKELYEQVIVDACSKSKLINELVKYSEYIIDQLGLEYGFKFLFRIAAVASCPIIKIDYISISQTNNKNLNDKPHFNSTEKPREGVFDSTERFLELFNFIINNIKMIKKGIERGTSVDRIAIYLAEVTGIFFEAGCELKKKIYENIEKINKNDNLKKNPIYKIRTELFDNFGKLSEIRIPACWMVKDFHSDYLYSIKNPHADFFKDLDFYSFMNVFKYQFLKSLEYGIDFVDCMDKKLILNCKIGCKKCTTYNYVKDVKLLFNRMNRLFDYSEIKKEALDFERRDKKFNESTKIHFDD